jgi:hypothetical protein
MKLITYILLIGTLSGAAVFGADEEILSDPVKILRKYQTDREEKLINSTFPEIEASVKYAKYREESTLLSRAIVTNRKKEEALKAMYKEIEEYRGKLKSQYSKIEFPEIKKNYIWDTYNLRKIDVCLKD